MMPYSELLMETNFSSTGCVFIKNRPSCSLSKASQGLTVLHCSKQEAKLGALQRVGPEPYLLQRDVFDQPADDRPG